MSRFAGIGYYDLSALFASYTGKHKRGLVESVSPLHRGVRTLDLMNDREEAPLLAEWKSAQAFLQKVSARLKALPRPADLMNAFVLAFDPGGYEQWHDEDVIDPDAFMRVNILLNPCPTFRLYAGEEMFCPSPWVAIASDHRVPTSMSNFNAPAVAHNLVLELALDAHA